MSEEELYKLLNIPNKPWIELTDEEIQLFEKNNNYIKQLQQENSQLKQQINTLQTSGDIVYTMCPKCNTKYQINYCREVQDLKQQLKDKDEKISEVKEFIKSEMCLGFTVSTNCNIYSIGINHILEILETNKED